MTIGWSIGKHRIEVFASRSTFVTIRIDDEVLQDPLIPGHLLGSYPFKLGRREIVLKRVRNMDVARSEIWVDGVKIPPSEVSISRRKPPAGAVCKAHVTGGKGYRDQGSAPPAKLACGICRTPLCTQCAAADGVRCKDCFDRAVVEMQKLERSQRIKGPLIGVGLGVIIAILGAAFGSGIIFGAGLALVALVVFRVLWGLYQERREQSAEPRKVA